MSRNHQRQKKAKTAVTLRVSKATRRRVKTPTPSPDASGDEGYSALENLSDSDEDEDSVQAAEREYLIKQVRGHFHHSARPHDDNEDDGDDEDDDEDDGYEEEDEEDEGDEEDGGAESEPDDQEDDESSWNGIPTSPEAEEVDEFAAMHPELSSPQSQPSRKVVRFNVPPDVSSDDDTDTDQDGVAEMFPDIFYNLDSLPQNIRRQYEQDSPADDMSAFEALDTALNGLEYSTAESDPEAILLRQYDTDTPISTPIVGGPQNSFLLPAVSMTVQAMAQSPELDGDETEGDTTDEDIPALSPAPVKKHKRRLSVGAADAESDTDKTPVRSSKGQPRVGRFNLDRSATKPIAVLDPITKRMLIFTRSKLDLSPELFRRDYTINDLFGSLEQSCPISGSIDSSPMPMDTMFFSSNLGDMNFDAVFGNGTSIDWSSLGNNRLIPVDESFFFSRIDHSIGKVGDEGEEYLDLDNFIKRGSFEETTDGDETDAHPSMAGAGGASDMEDIFSTTFPTDLPLPHDQLLTFEVPNDMFVDLDVEVGTILEEQLTASPKRRRRSSAAMRPPSSPIESVLQKRKSVEHHQEPAHKRQRSITADVAQLKM